MSHPRFRWMAAAATAASLIVALSGCGAITNGSTSNAGTSGSTGEFHLADYIKQDIKDKKKLVIKVSYHDPSLAFAKPVLQGVNEAGSKLGVDVQLIGPTGGDAGQQVSQIQTLITQKAIDGLAVSSASDDALKPVIAQAYNAGIPIVSFNTDNPGSKEMAFIGQDLTASGTSEAKQLVSTLNDKGVTSGKVVVFSLDTGAGWSNQRFSGFKAGIADSGFTVVGPVNTGDEPSAAYNTVASTMKGQKDAVAIAGLDCCSTTAAGSWVKQSGNTGKIVVGGFDLLPQTAQFIKGDVVDFAISQNPVKQGYEAVNVLVQYLRGGKKPATVDTGSNIISGANVATTPVEG